MTDDISMYDDVTLSGELVCLRPSERCMLCASTLNHNVIVNFMFALSTMSDRAKLQVTQNCNEPDVRFSARRTTVLLDTQPLIRRPLIKAFSPINNECYDKCYKEQDVLCYTFPFQCRLVIY